MKRFDGMRGATALAGVLVALFGVTARAVDLRGAQLSRQEGNAG
jgi:hypothetical protein